MLAALRSVLTAAMAEGLNVVGLMNVQFAIQETDGAGAKKDVIFVLEVNPRASRTVPSMAGPSSSDVNSTASEPG